MLVFFQTVKRGYCRRHFSSLFVLSDVDLAVFVVFSREPELQISNRQSSFAPQIVTKLKATKSQEMNQGDKILFSPFYSVVIYRFFFYLDNLKYILIQLLLPLPLVSLILYFFRFTIMYRIGLVLFAHNFQSIFP